MALSNEFMVTTDHRQTFQRHPFGKEARQRKAETSELQMPMEQV